MTMRIALNSVVASKTSCPPHQYCPINGRAYDKARLMCSTMNISCKFVYFDTDRFGDVLPNGTSTGIVKVIESGEADTSLPVFTPTFSRSKAVSFSEYLIQSDIVFVTRSPYLGITESDRSVIQAFQWPVWLTFLLSVFAVGLTLHIGKYLHGDSGRNENRVWRSYGMCHSLEAYLESCSQLGTWLFSGYTSKIPVSAAVTISFWLFAVTFLIMAYSSLMFSMKMRPPRLPFRDLESFVECLERDECTLVSPTLSISYFQYLTAPGTPLGDRMQSILTYNPIQIMPYLDTVRAMLETKDRYMVRIINKYAFTDILPSELGTICDFYFVDWPVTEYGTFPVSKNFSALSNLNKAVFAIREFGLDNPIDAKYDKYRFQLCGSNGGNQGDMLKTMSLTFWIWGLGVMAAIVAFVSEIVLARKCEILGHIKRR